MGISIYNASAGSGKTHLLTHLLADLIKGEKKEIGKIKPEKVIATTFTKAAAAEIRERASKVLLVEGLIEESFALKDGLLGTVNSVCGGLLEKYSVFSKMSPETRVIDETERENLVNSFMGEVLTSDLTNMARSVGWVFNYNNNTDPLISNLNRTIDLVRYNAIDLKSQKDINELVESTFNSNYENGVSGGLSQNELRSRINSILTNLLSEGKAFVNAGGRGDKGVKKNVIDKLEKSYFGNPLKEYLTYQLSTLKAVSDCPKGFRESFEQSKGIIFEGLIEEVAFSQARKDELIKFATEFFNAALEVLKKYQNHKTNEGLIDFADQESLFLELLKHEFVRADISASFDVVFVDEFQDTSPIQLAVFSELNKLIKHSVWIGDPKQSIYGFRGADSELMNQIVSAVNSDSNLQGVLKQKEDELKTSYRSRKELVDFSNELFVDVFDGVKKENVVLKPLEDRDTAEESCAIHIWEEPASKKGTVSPNSLANKVKEVIDNSDFSFYPKGSKEARRLKPGDICLLTRGNKEVISLAAELSSFGLKVNAPMQGLINTPEVFSIIAALKCIQNPKDKLSKIELLTVANSFGNVEQSVIDVENGNEDDIEIFKVLSDVNSITKGLSVSGKIDTILSTTSFLERIVGLNNEFQALANIKELQQNSRKYESYCENNGFVASVYGFEMYLNQLDASQGYSVHEECVNIMTYHKAKGLEFPMVIVTDLQKAIRPSFGVTTTGLEDFDASSPLKDRKLEFLLDDDFLKDAIKEELLNKQVRENKRLMYVGITRSRDFLVIPYRAKANIEIAQINLLSSATNDKLGHSPLYDLPIGKGSIKISEKEFSVVKSELEQGIYEEENSVDVFVNLPKFELTSTNKKKKLKGSGKDKIYNEPMFSEFESEKLDFKIALEREKVTLFDSEFGNAIHHVFQQIGKGNGSNITSVLKNWTIDGAIKASYDFVESFQVLNNEITKNHGDILDVLLEQSFRYKKNGQELDGIIDAAFLTQKGWVIIDYKSHSNLETNLIEFSKAKGYLTQLNNYSEAINGLRSNEVIGAGLYYPFVGEVLWAVKN